MKKEDEILGKTSHMYNRKTDLAWEKIREMAGLEGAPAKKRLAPPLLYKIAAVFLLVAGLGWGIRMILPGRPHTVHTSWGQQKIRLPDGSTVFLNGNSTVKFPGKFKGKFRVVNLSGEAFFRVKKDKRQPFVVKVPEGKIEVVGTSFNVRAPENGPRAEVLVQTGVVEVSGTGHAGDVLTLHKGEFGVIKNGEAVKKVTPGANYLSWRTKVIRFRRERLSKVVAVLNRAYAKNLVLSGDTLRKLELTSVYDHVGFDTVLESICLTFHLKAEKKQDKIVLKRIK